MQLDFAAPGAVHTEEKHHSEVIFQDVTFYPWELIEPECIGGCVAMVRIGLGPFLCDAAVVRSWLRSPES